MKKLLFFAFCIFSSVFILPSDSSESKTLDEELCSAILKLKKLDKEKKNAVKHEGLRQKMADGLAKAFVEGDSFFYREVSQEEFVQRISAIRQKMIDDSIKLGEDGKDCHLSFRQTISISFLVSSEEKRRSEERRLAEIAEQSKLDRLNEITRFFLLRIRERQQERLKKGSLPSDDLPDPFNKFLDSLIGMDLISLSASLPAQH
jgi:hypothetical protein